jgi:outer membrane protein insertion porin family
MAKRLGLFLLASFCLLPSSLIAQQKVSVVILPFAVHAPSSQAELQEEISRALEKRLQADGAVIVDPYLPAGETWQSEGQSLEDIRDLGIKSGADFIIWGSLTRVGRKFSLDANMLEPFTQSPAMVFSAEGTGFENLPAAVGELAREMELKLFDWRKIADVRVEGNQRIEDDAILKAVKTQAGDIYRPAALSQDLKAVYALGYFDDVRIEATDAAAGKVITFRVKEKPTIRIVAITGNKDVYDDDEIKQSLDIKTGSVLNLLVVQNNIERIKELYQQENYHNVEVAYKLQEQENNQVDLEFVIDEGEKVAVEKITFEGNKAYSDKELKKQMQSKEKGWFSWLTDSGTLNREDLSQDAARIAAFYQNNGFIEARVGEPEVVFKDEWIEITIKIDEGPQYRVGQVDLAGDLIQPKEQLFAQMKLVEEEYFSREVMRSDVITLTDLYADQGYARVDVSPRIDKNPDKLIVDVVYQIEKGQLAYFEEIIISGNTKTRDKVIRRQLQVYEGELYSSGRLKAGIRNLERLDFFEDIRVDMLNGSADDLMVLKLDVAEKPTGEFTFGGGFSSVDRFFGVASVKQKNLFGRGQILNLEFSLGEVSQRFRVNFTEPWLFDIPLAANVAAYNWEYEYDTYEKDSLGGGAGLSYPVWPYTRGTLRYEIESVKLTNIDDDAPSNIRELRGRNTKSSVISQLNFDTRNRRFNPTRGSQHIAWVEYAGIGGDIAFTKFVGETGWYFPLFWETAGFVRAKGGYVTENAGGILPDYELFRLGGIDSLRGFEWEDLAPEEEEGVLIGGDKFVQFNFEFIFPILKETGLDGVVFFDTGDVYDSGENLDFGNLAKSTGGGIRWNSPLGPLRVEYGFIIDDADKGGSGGRVEIAMGSSF